MGNSKSHDHLDWETQTYYDKTDVKISSKKGNTSIEGKPFTVDSEVKTPPKTHVQPGIRRKYGIHETHLQKVPNRISDQSNCPSVSSCNLQQPTATPVAMKPSKPLQPISSRSSVEMFECVDCETSTKTTEIYPEMDFCLICGKLFFESLSCHGSSLDHKIIRETLLRRIYPYQCAKCPLRFICNHELKIHRISHPIQKQVEFNPWCCYLCLLPFKTKIIWQAHMLSDEHIRKEKMAKEIGQREQLLTKKVMLSTVSTQTDTDCSLNNSDNGTLSQSDHSNDSNYFCCPCAVYVPKSNVISHEQGRNHKKSCEIWLSNLSRKSTKSNCHQDVIVKIPSNESEVAINKDILNFPEPLKSLGSEASQKTSLNNISKPIETMNGFLDNEKLTSEPFLNSSQNFQPVHGSCDPNNSVASVLDSLFKKYSEQLVSEHPEGNHEPKPPMPIYQSNNLVSHNQNRNSQLQVKNDQDSSSLICPNDSNAVPAVPCGPSIQEKQTKEDIIEPLEEYFKIDQIIRKDKKPVIKYACTYCKLNPCIMQNMIAHIFSNCHRGIYMNQNIRQLERKIEIIEFLQRARNKHKILNAMDNVPVMKTLVELKRGLERGKGAINKMFPANTRMEKDSVECFQESDRGEEFILKDTIVIGNSNSSTLQEEVEQACEGNEIDDFEYECEICGVVIQIFNEDIDLSMDMHIQNDPQHQLATAVPVERDAQKVAEMSKTLPMSVINQDSKFARNKLAVIEEILLLEKRYVVLQPNGFRCLVCSNFVRKSLAAHHLLSRKHMTDKWADNYCDVELQQKCKVLFSLQKYNFAVGMLNGAIIRIRQFILSRSQKRSITAENDQNSSMKDLKSTGEAVPTIAQVQQSMTTKPGQSICPICLLNITQLKKAARRSHRENCRKALAQELSVSNPPTQKVKDTAQPSPKTFFCDICNRSMPSHSRKGHLSGQSHKSNMAQKKITN